MSGSDGIESYTRVPTARHMWGLRPCLLVLDNKCHHFLRILHLVKSIRHWKLLGGASRCPGPSRVRDGGISDRHVAKSYLLMSTVMRKVEGVDYSWV
jgi:hypothetical protein